jgi:hypothetical protein
VLDPVQVDSHGQVRGPVADLVPVPDFDHQGVQVEDRVELLQRPGLPGLDLLQHGVGDRRDGVVGQLHAQRAGQMVGDVAHGHPARVQRHDHLVQAAGAAGTLRDQPGLEAALPVARGVQPHRPDLGLQGFRGRTVARVRAAPTGRVSTFVAQVLGQLRLQAPLEHRFDHLREEPALPGQGQLAGVDPVHQLVEQPSIEHVVDRLPGRAWLRRVGDTQWVSLVGRHESVLLLNLGSGLTQTI